MMHSLTRLIKERTGERSSDFVKNKLGLFYSTFCYRIRTGNLTLKDIHTILRETKLSFEEVFPDPQVPVHLQRIYVPPPALPRKKKKDTSEILTDIRNEAREKRKVVVAVPASTTKAPVVDEGPSDDDEIPFEDLGMGLVN